MLYDPYVSVQSVVVINVAMRQDAELILINVKYVKSVVGVICNGA